MLERFKFRLKLFLYRAWKLKIFMYSFLFIFFLKGFTWVFQTTYFEYSVLLINKVLFALLLIIFFHSCFTDISMILINEL